MASNPSLILSQSSIQDYVDCPRRFKLHYIDHLTYPAMESEPALDNEKNMQEGELFHRLVQQSLLGLDPEKLARLAAPPNLDRWWRNFVDHGPSLEGWKLYPEYSLSAPLEGSRLIAKYDLLAVRDGWARIYDWKTYKRQPRKDRLAARWQTRVYPALLARSGGFLAELEAIPPENIEMHYWFPEFPGEPVVFTYDSRQYKRDWNALAAIAQEIEAEQEYLKTEDLPRCKFCTYRSYCGRGTEAALEEERDLDLELTGMEGLDFEQIGEIAF